MEFGNAMVTVKPGGEKGSIDRWDYGEAKTG
jgi:hypothetical protein